MSYYGYRERSRWERFKEGWFELWMDGTGCMVLLFGGLALLIGLMIQADCRAANLPVSGVVIEKTYTPSSSSTVTTVTSTPNGGAGVGVGTSYESERYILHVKTQDQPVETYEVGKAFWYLARKGDIVTRQERVWRLGK